MCPQAVPDRAAGGLRGSACQPQEGWQSVLLPQVGHLREGDLAGGKSSDKCLPSYSICSTAVAQAKKFIF